jgi:hypothetical protein
MGFHLAAPIAAFLLVADPGPTAPVAPPPDPQILAIDLGQVVGAAQQCDSIDKSRIAAATAKAKALVAAAAHSSSGPDEDANRRFADGMADGQDAVTTGETNCASAEAALKALEQQAAPK